MGQRALDLAGTSIDEVELIDLYSCFPAAVELGAQSLGIDLTERQWSRTGGLPFCGGPWNNYPMHAIATMVDRATRRADRSRPRLGERRIRHQALVRRLLGDTAGRTSSVTSRRSPRSMLSRNANWRPVPTPQAPADIEAYSVMFSRDGEPETAFAACLLADGRRAWGRSDDSAVTAAMCDGEWVGVTVHLDADSRMHV